MTTLTLRDPALLRPNQYVTETFDTLSSTTAAGWTGSGNRSNGYDFGWSNSSNVTGSAGEIGGIFIRSTSFAYFADTTIRPLNRTESFIMQGSMRLVNVNYDGGINVGYFDSNLTSRLGIAIEEPAGATTDPFRVSLSGGGLQSTRTSAAHSTVLTFSVSYVGSADGSGVLSGTIAGSSHSVSLGAGSATFVNFGLSTGITGTGSNQVTGGCFFDNLTYAKF